MAAKKSTPARVASTSTSLPASRDGKAKRKKYICLYGPPKARKTTACLTLNARFIITDQNFQSTADDRADLDQSKIHPAESYDEALSHVETLLNICRTEGVEALDCEAVVFDSVTATHDMVEAVTPAESNGFARWDKIVGKLRALNDALYALSEFVHVIAIAHAPAKASEAVSKKGEWAILSLPGKLGEFFARSVSWLLFAGGESCSWELQTLPVGPYFAAASSRMKDLSEVHTSDLRELMVEAGLLE